MWSACQSVPGQNSRLRNISVGNGGWQFVLMAEWVLLRHAEDTGFPFKKALSRWLHPIGPNRWDGQRYRKVLLSLQAKQSGQPVRAIFPPALCLLKMAAWRKWQWEIQPSGFQKAMSWTNSAYTLQTVAQQLEALPEKGSESCWALTSMPFLPPELPTPASISAEVCLCEQTDVAMETSLPAKVTWH